MTRKPAFAHFGKHVKKIWRNLLSIQNEAISLVAMHGEQRTVIGPIKSRHCKTWLESRFSWNENSQRKQNWTAKSTNLKKCWKSQVSFCHQRSPLSRKPWTLPWTLLLCPEKDWSIRVGKQGYVFVLTDFKKWCLNVSFVTPICVINYFVTGNFLSKLMS